MVPLATQSKHSIKNHLIYLFFGGGGGGVLPFCQSFSVRQIGVRAQREASSKRRIICPVYPSEESREPMFKDGSHNTGETGSVSLPVHHLHDGIVTSGEAL